MKILENLKPLSLFGLRLALGVIFFNHGYEKLTGHAKDMLAEYVRLGFPSSIFYIVGTLELFGGILLLIGLLTRISSLMLAIEMGVALAKVDIPRGGIYAVH